MFLPMLGLPLPPNRGAGAFDPFAGNVGVLMHFDGVDGAAVFTEETGLTVTPSGLVKTLTAAAKFGDTGGDFPNSAGNYLTIGYDSRFQIGTGAFTVEFWGKNLDRVSTEGAIIVGQANDLTAPDARWVIYTNPSGPVLGFAAGTGGGLFNSVNTTVAINTADGAYHHYAFAGDGSVLRIFQDGILAGSVGYSSFASTRDLLMGSATLANALKGNLDELRITKGVARYTENFTPPAAPFPNP